MKAFFKRDNMLIKAYDKGDDWQTIDNQGNERWYSKWKVDEIESLRSAIFRHANYVYGVWISESEIVIVE